MLYKYSPTALNAPSAAPVAGGSATPFPIAQDLAVEDAALYTLVTDEVFLHEPSVVWERLEDVDGGWSTFVDSDFVKASPAGGDFAGQTAEEALRAAEAIANGYLGTVDPNE